MLNRNDLDEIEKRELHLTVLAAVFVLVQGAGLAVLMYPLVFERPDEPNKWTMRVAYFGFCTLTLLFVSHFMERQSLVRKLKQDLLEQFDRNVQIRQQASLELLQSMPGKDHFWDRLPMDFRRATTTSNPLSLLLVQAKRGPVPATAEQKSAAAGDTAQAISRKLRPTDSIYNLSPELFALVLPDSDTQSAQRVALRIQEELQAVRNKYGLTFDIAVHNYPQHVKSSHELEDIVKSLLPDNQKWEVPVTADAV